MVERDAVGEVREPAGLLAGEGKLDALAGLFTAGASTCQSSSARMWLKTPWASFSSSRGSKVSAEADAPKATRLKASRSVSLRAEPAIRFMASSRMSWALGSSSRSRPETMALAGLMKS